MITTGEARRIAEGGREDLADRLLRLAGSETLSRAEVERRVAELWPAYDAAVEARRTPVAMDWNVSREARALECASAHGGPGHPRERRRRGGAGLVAAGERRCSRRQSVSLATLRALWAAFEAIERAK